MEAVTLQQRTQKFVETLSANTGIKQVEREEAARGLVQAITQADATLQEQAQKIDELGKQVDELTRQASEPKRALVAATKELAGLRDSSAEEKRELEEQLAALKQELAAKGEINDQSEEVAQLTEKLDVLEREKVEMGEQHAAAIEAQEERVAALDIEAKKVAPLQAELAELKRTADETTASLKEEIRRLGEERDSFISKDDYLAQDAELSKLTERLEQATKEFEEQILAKEQELVALRKTATQVEDLTARLDEATERQKREAEKAIAVKAQLDIAMKVASMTPAAIEERLAELEGTSDELEGFEKAVLEQHQKALLSAVEAKARELEEVAEKRRAEVEAQQMMLEKMQRQREQDARLLQTSVREIPNVIRTIEEKMLAPAVDGLRQIEAGEQEDPTGALKQAQLEAKASAEHEIAMLQTLQKFHQISQEVLVGGLEQQLARLSEALKAEREGLQKLENPVGETPRDEPAIFAQTQKIALMEEEFARLEDLYKAQGAVVATDVIAAANAFRELAALLKDDMNGMAPFEALKQMVEVLDDIRTRNLKYQDEPNPVPVAQVKGRLSDIIRFHNALSDVVEETLKLLEITGVRNSESLPQIQAALQALKDAAARVPQLTDEKTQLEWEKGVLGTMQRLVLSIFAMIWSIPSTILGGIQGAGSLIVSRKK